MKRNLLYLGVLLLLAGLTWFFVFREPRTGFNRGEAHFTVKDTNAVTALFLSDMQGNGVKLTRNGKAWTLNDSLRPRPTRSVSCSMPWRSRFPTSRCRAASTMPPCGN